MSAPVSPNSFINEYRLIDFVGAGGMGEVYRAVNTRDGRVVAIKLLTRVGSAAKTVDRFMNEARIQASLNHPNITTFHELITHNGQPCIIMEYVDGQTLADRIKSFGVLPLPEVIYILQAVTDAIAYIHASGIVHRDIKSNNIKIGSAGQIKLLDFGIAKSESTPKLTATGSTIGTLEYLAPEQLKGGTSDARADIWALGIMLYEMVTGRVPFEANTIGDLCDKIMKADYVRASSLNPSIPAELEAIVSRCLKKKPADRFQTAHEILRELSKLSAAVSAPRWTSAKVGVDLSWLKQKWVLISGAAAAIVVIAGAYLLLSPNPSPQENGVLKPRTVQGSDKPAQNDAGKSTQSGTQALSVGDSQMKKIRVNAFGGQADVYASDGTWRSKTPYEFSGRFGEEVKLVLKRDGYVDYKVNFRVGEDNSYDIAMEKADKERR